MLQFAVLGVVLAACQAVTTVGDLGGEKDAEDLKPVAEEAVGSGAVQVAFLLPMTGAGSPIEESRGIRNGALLAHEDLGKNQLTVTIADTGGQTDRMKAVSGQHASDGTDLLVVFGGDDDVISASAGSVPVVALAPNSAPRPAGVFAFLFGDIDSLVKGIEFAALDGKKRIVLFSPRDNDRSTFISQALSSRASIYSVTYGPRENAGAIVGRAGGSLEEADAVAFAGSDEAIPRVAALIRARGGGKLALIGHSGWPASILGKSALKGAIVAQPEVGDLRRISTRYKQKFGTEPKTEAAYGYDMVAIAAGIARSAGADGLNRASLLSQAGFRGATGAFRFRADGSVERLYEINTVQSGKLAPLARAPDRF